MTQNGRTTTVIQTSSVVTANPNASNNSKSSSSPDHTGAIVGGVVGGVVALAALILLFWFCRRRRKADDFDGNFDPDRVVAARGSTGVGRDDLLEGAQVTPYSYSPGDTSSGAPTSEMRQQGGVDHSLLDAAGLGAAGVGGAAIANHNRQQSASTYGRGGGKRPLSDGTTSDLGNHRPSQDYAPTETSHSGSGSAYPYGASPYPAAMGAAGGAAAGAYLGPGRHPSPGPSLPSTASSPTSGSHYSQPTAMTTGRLAKEREAFAGRQQQGAGSWRRCI